MYPYTWKPYPREGGWVGATPPQNTPGREVVQVRPTQGLGQPHLAVSLVEPSSGSRCETARERWAWLGSVGGRPHPCWHHLGPSLVGILLVGSSWGSWGARAEVELFWHVMWWRMDELLCMIHLSSLFSLDVDYISLLFFDMPCEHVAFLFWVRIFPFFSFFLTCLLSMWHTFFGYASFISFLHNPHPVWSP